MIDSFKNNAQSSLSGCQIYLNEIGQTSLLTPEEEHQLAERIMNGDLEALEHMIKANLRLVVKIAQDYENMGSDLNDLIQAGNIGLMIAAKRFDPDKGAKFSTYAALWIKQRIRRELSNQGRTIRQPVHFISQRSEINQAIRDFEAKYERPPNTKELEEATGYSQETIRFALERNKSPLSLDSESDVNDQKFGDTIADTNAPPPGKALEQKEASNSLESYLDVLDHRELTIIKQRFGLDGNTPKTLEDVGHDFGITRERIRQIQDIAIEKMKRVANKTGTKNMADLFSSPSP